MDIENSFIKKQNHQLKLQIGFLKLKVNYLQANKKPSEISLVNKQLYLNYMEDVLTNKQNQLIQLEQQLSEYYKHRNQQQADNKILIPLKLSTELQMMSKKIQEAKKPIYKLSPEGQRNWEDFLIKEKEIISQCKKYQKQTEDLVREQYQKMIDQRKEINQKMAKFYELNAYQKYLSQLQKLLQDKQEELLQKQEQLVNKQEDIQGKMQNSQQKSISFINDSSCFPNKDHSQRKRVRIFDSTKKQITSAFKSKNGNNLCNQSFGFTNSESKRQNSSNIMQEHPSNSYNSSYSGKKLQINNNQAEQQQKKIQSTTNQQCSSPKQTLQTSLKRLQNQRKYCKFTNLWLKYSFKSQKSTSQAHKKTMMLYLWRLNALFDSKIINQITHRDQEQWPFKYQESLRSKKMFPYNQLSLKRKKYCQMVYDHDKKLLHQRKIRCLLQSIIKNKIRRERLCVFIYFKKYSENNKLKMVQQYYKSVLIAKAINKQMPITQYAETSRNQTESRLISMTSSHIMHQTRPLFGQTKELVNQKLNKSHKTSNVLVSKSPSNLSLLGRSANKISKTSKQNVVPSGFDAKKLKQYIKTQEQTQKALATQCIQVESILKMSQSLTSIFNKKLFSSYLQIRVLSEEERVGNLQKKINEYEFKWELFTTKCKLGLVNNSSKISQLEDTLAFMIER